MRARRRTTGRKARGKALALSRSVDQTRERFLFLLRFLASATENPWRGAKGQLDILRALRDWNIDLSATTNEGRSAEGRSAAHIAAQEGHLDILRALRDWNIDLSATDNRGRSAAHIAAAKGHLDFLRALRDWNIDLSATINDGSNAAHLAAKNGHLDVLTELKAWQVDLGAEANDGTTPLKFAVVGDTALRTAQHLILLGVQVWPTDFPASHIEVRQQLMAWIDDYLEQHRAFIYTVLTAIHDDGAHTAEGQINWLARLQGHGTVFRLRIRVAEYLGIPRVGSEHWALVNARECDGRMAHHRSVTRRPRRKRTWRHASSNAV